MSEPLISQLRFLVAAITLCRPEVGVGPLTLRWIRAFATRGYKLEQSKRDVIVDMARLLYPHEGLSDDAYASVLDMALTCVATDAASSGLRDEAETFAGLDEQAQIAALDALGDASISAAIRVAVRSHLHHHPAEWEVRDESRPGPTVSRWARAKDWIAGAVAFIPKAFIALATSLLAGLLVMSFVRELLDGAVVVLPVSIPQSIQKDGYTPITISQRIVKHMVDVSRGADTDPSEPQMMKARQIIGSDELPDIQMPGLGFSLRTISDLLRRELGLATTVNINIADEGDWAFVVDIRVVDGFSTRNSQSFRFYKAHAVDQLLLTTAVRAVRAASPLAFGGYITEIIDQPLRCPVGIDCSVESAFESLSPLLRDSNPLRSDTRLVLAVASLRQAAAVERAEQTPSPSGAKSPSDPAGTQNSKAESYWLAQAYQYCDQSRKEDPRLVWPHIICGLAQYRQTLQPQCATTADTAGALLSGTFKTAYTARALLGGTFKALFPNLEADAGLHAGFGDLLLEMQCFDEAEQQYEAAIRLNSRNSYSMVGLGTIARRHIRLGEAAYHYAEALKVNPVEPYANGGLGATLYDQNNANVADAIPHLDRALAFEPTYEVAVQACKKIDMAQNAQKCTLHGDRAVQ